MDRSPPLTGRPRNVRNCSHADSQVWQTNAAAVSAECTPDAIVAVNFSVGVQRIGGGVIPQLRVSNAVRLQTHSDATLADEVAAPTTALTASPSRQAPSSVRADIHSPARQTFTSRMEELAPAPARPSTSPSPTRPVTVSVLRSPPASPTRPAAELPVPARAGSAPTSRVAPVLTVQEDGDSDSDVVEEEDVQPVRVTLKRRRN